MSDCYALPFGSRLYGTETTNSDTDWVVVWFPNQLDFVTGFTEVESKQTSPGVKNTKDDVDTKKMASTYVARKLMENDLYCYDVLFSPFADDYLKKNRHRLLPTDAEKFKAYVRQQVRLFDPVRYQNLEAFMENPDKFLVNGHYLVEGKDYQNLKQARKAVQGMLSAKSKVGWKNLSHAVRCTWLVENVFFAKTKFNYPEPSEVTFEYPLPVEVCERLVELKEQADLPFPDEVLLNETVAQLRLFLEKEFPVRSEKYKAHKLALLSTWALRNVTVGRPF